MVSAPAEKDVFINVPFDRAYEPLFIALVGTLTFLRKDPHCVLEVRETGEGRLVRIFELMRTCRISIHDVSRVSMPSRFNMAFELGLACALKLLEPEAYEIFVLDAKPFRIDRTLSDYKGRDALIHHNRPDGVVSCLLDMFEARQAVTATEVRRGVDALAVSAEDLKRDLQIDSLFRPALFRHLLAAATDIGIRQGLIQP